MVDGQSVIIVTQARVGSSRLSRKVLRTVGDKTMLQIHLERILASNLADQIIVATTVEPEAVEIVQITSHLGLSSYRGSINDVLERFYQSLVLAPPDYLVRLTSDCPLIDAKLLDEVIEFTVRGGYDYVSNAIENSFPDGQDIEVFTFKALETAWQQADLPSDREHVTPFIRRNSNFSDGSLFRAAHFVQGADYGNIRMTVDEPSDFAMLEILIDQLGTQEDWRTYASFITDQHEQFTNQKIIRNEGYLKSLAKDKKNYE